ncbi:hypothetical protein ITJ64_06695 [Herbiconiux sp. VKM Ac-1786]|uniref:hypothetical protein n=1 Tax=Herbiconiux sp. VKM Ac-1786 TaxID=2783824 RepID=UPI00188C0949|nr:hypothetical protein [Herbiconiux sp. VKM Ac-1786]MBF4572201.1 hypothetical protein [Herbiconiux sp. VKM Ac-1786]
MSQTPPTPPSGPSDNGLPPLPPQQWQQPNPGQPEQPPRHPGYPGLGQQGQPNQPGQPGQPGQQGQPGQPGQPPKKGLGTGAILGIVGGGLLLVIIVIVVIAVVVSRLLVGGGGGSSSSGGSGGGETGTASDTVEAFFTALSDADAETALGMISQAPDDDTLLTDEVLAASNELAPITGFAIVDDTTENGYGDVTVSYSLGGTPVTAEYSVDDYDEDGWMITGGLSYLNVDRFDGLGVTVNGQEVTGGELQVFPGTYELATTLPNFTLSGTTTVAATEPFGSLDVSDIEPGLSEAALGQFRSLVQSAVDACIASTTLAAGCGLDLPATLDDGTQLTEGTISRSISADATVTIQNMVPTLSYDNPTLAQGEYIGSVSTSGQCTQNGATGTCDVLFGPSLGSPSIDMAAENPTVLWD